MFIRRFIERHGFCVDTKTTTKKTLQIKQLYLTEQTINCSILKTLYGNFSGYVVPHTRLLQRTHRLTPWSHISRKRPYTSPTICTTKNLNTQILTIQQLLWRKEKKCLIPFIRHCFFNVVAFFSLISDVEILIRVIESGTKAPQPMIDVCQYPKTISLN